MNKQEAIQLLEEMGIDKRERCPYCDEILINRLRKIKSPDGKHIIYKCTHCGLTFKLMYCKVCNKKRLHHPLNICKECFKKKRLTDLTKIKDKVTKDYKKIMLIRCRKKPDIKFSITRTEYNKIKLKCIDSGMTLSEYVYRLLKKDIS